MKRIERLWRLEGHRLPPRRLKESGQKARGVGENSPATGRRLRAQSRLDLRLCFGPGASWRQDSHLERARRVHRVSLGSKVSRSIGATAVDCPLRADSSIAHGKPTEIRSDNGREFIASTVVDWLKEQGVEAVFIEKASPQQNPFIERFNGTMRRDLLNVEEMDNVTEAQVLVNSFNEEYNHVRPHRALNMMTPHNFAESYKLAGR